MKLKKTTSVILAAVMTATSLFCVTAATTDTQNYKPAVETAQKAETQPEKDVVSVEAPQPEVATKAADEKSSEPEAETSAPAEVKETKKVANKKAPSIKKSKEVYRTASSQTFEYSFVVKTPEKIAAFDAEVTFPTTLSVADDSCVTIMGEPKSNFAGWCNTDHTNDGYIKFNYSSSNNALDYTDGVALVSIMFTGNPADASQINTTLYDFYDRDKSFSSENVTYRYKELVDGARVDGGLVAKGSEDVYDITYSYNLNGTASTYRKVVTSASGDVDEVINSNAPKLKTPDYNYTIGTSNANADNEISVNLNRAARKYTVSVEDYTADDSYTREVDYLKTTKLTTTEDSIFMIGGQIVATGTEFTFFVGGNTEVIIMPNDDYNTDKFATISRLGYTVEQERIRIQLLATAKTDDFKRIGIAYSTTKDLTKSEIEAAASEITVTDAKSHAASNGVIIHNSTVDDYNVSGQYQFIFTPNMKISTGKDRTLWFYAFVVDDNGDVTVSEDGEEVVINSILS
jgi:hypothetical protein